MNSYSIFPVYFGENTVAIFKKSDAVAMGFEYTHQDRNIFNIQ